MYEGESIEDVTEGVDPKWADIIHISDLVQFLFFLSPDVSTVKCRFNESRFNVKSRFKVQNVVTKIEFDFKKSRFGVKSRFKESNCAARGHSLNRDFSAQLNLLKPSYSGKCSFTCQFGQARIFMKCKTQDTYYKFLFVTATFRVVLLHIFYNHQTSYNITYSRC